MINGIIFRKNGITTGANAMQYSKIVQIVLSIVGKYVTLELGMDTLMSDILKKINEKGFTVGEQINLEIQDAITPKKQINILLCAEGSLWTLADYLYVVCHPHPPNGCITIDKSSGNSMVLVATDEEASAKLGQLTTHGLGKVLQTMSGKTIRIQITLTKVETEEAE